MEIYSSASHIVTAKSATTTYVERFICCCVNSEQIYHYSTLHRLHVQSTSCSILKVLSSNTNSPCHASPIRRMKWCNGHEVTKDDPFPSLNEMPLPADSPPEMCRELGRAKLTMSLTLLTLTLPCERNTHIIKRVAFVCRHRRMSGRKERRVWRQRRLHQQEGIQEMRL